MTKQYDSTSVRAVIFHEQCLLVEWCSALSIYFAVGGTIETQETLEATLRRELQEEISAIDFTIGKYLGKIGHYWAKQDGTTGSCLNHFFEVHLPKSQDPSLVMAKETGRSIQWLDLKSSEARLLQPPSLKNLLLQSHDHAKLKIWDEIDREMQARPSKVEPKSICFKQTNQHCLFSYYLILSNTALV